MAATPPAHPRRGGAVTALRATSCTARTTASSKVFAVAGSQGNYNNYVLDGGTNTDVFTQPPNLPFPFPTPPRVLVEANSLPARKASIPAASSTESPTPATTSGTAPSSTSFATTSSTPTTSSPPPRTPSNATSSVHPSRQDPHLTSSSSSVASRERNRTISSATLQRPASPRCRAHRRLQPQGGNCPQNLSHHHRSVTGANISATRKLPASSISQQP